jgi:small subunit ribosomal protein S5
MVTINLHNDTIPHDSQAKVSGANIYIKPASQGTGLIAGGVVRVVLEVAGVKNILSKSLGSNNKINSAYATLKALQLVEPSKNWITRTNHSVATKEAPKSVVQDEVSKPKATKAPVKKAEAKKEVKK